MVDSSKFNNGDDLPEIPDQDVRGDKKKGDRVQHINFGEEDQMEIQGFTGNKLRTHFCTLMYVLTLGILRLIFHWFPYLHLIATHDRSSLGKAEKVVITNRYHGKSKTYFVKSVKVLESKDVNSNYASDMRKLLKFRLADGVIKESYHVRIVRCKKLTYIWDEERGRFVRLAGLENGILRSSLHECKGQSVEEQSRKRIVYGDNEINIPEQSTLTLLVLEALTPFYIFQFFSLVVWIAELYYYYTVAIVIMSVIGISTSVIQTRKNQRNLKRTINATDSITVCRGDGMFEEASTGDLVPGDLILIPKYGCEVHCDAVLLSGSCIVNESMLTGESVPVTKTPLPNNDTLYSVKEDMNHTLFCGTKVIQTRTHGKEKVLAVVIRTGYLTTKGELVRSILYPPPADFKFDQDSYKYIAILSFIAALGFLYTIVSKVSRRIAPLDITIKALDLITIVIPPALPAAMTVGKLYALSRLKKSQIYCINSRVINVAGSVDCVCFDKTGTLTEDALDMWAVVPIDDGKICEPVKNVKHMRQSSKLLQSMTVCHTLTKIDGEICGDPLDVKMFKSTGWVFDHQPTGNGVHVVKSPPNEPSQALDVVKQFQFSSTLQRMSVIAKSTKNSCFEVFCKGSPERIVSLSNPETVPSGTFKKLKEYTEQGYRVIGIGTKQLNESASYEDVAKMTRDDVEDNLEFLGFIVLENKLKPQTMGIIRTLKDAELKIVMITGDNMQTAVTVAKECQILDRDAVVIEVTVTKPTKHDFAGLKYSVSDPGAPNKLSSGPEDVERRFGREYSLVMTGQCWSNLTRYFPELVPKMVAKGAVFARMSGLQKQQLIEELKKLGYYVAMCGDGANDCGALKAAHVGISLSEAESSVASPFTSKTPNISCAPEVIKEGRAALVTSFGVFKMMVCYSLTEFCSVIILYNIDSNLSAFQFLFIDIFLILNFASTFGRTKAYGRLAKNPPKTSLLSFTPICSITLFMLITVIFQVLAYIHVQRFHWFKPFIYNSHNLLHNFLSYEDYAVYCVSMFQYITMAIVFSKGKPYRMPIYTNMFFLASIILMTGVCVYISLYPVEFVWDLLELKIPPHFDGRLAILWIAFLNFCVCYFVEDVFVEIVLERFVSAKISRLTRSKKKYLEVLDDVSWPNVADDTRFSEVNENSFRNFGFSNEEFQNYNTKL